MSHRQCLERGIHNTCEVGRLKTVVLHRPGQELENLMPEYLERLLFDDIPYLKSAQEEHDVFADCLRSCGVEVLYLRDLVSQSITDGEVRNQFIGQFLDEAGEMKGATRDLLEGYLKELPVGDLVDTMMAGIRKSQVREFASVQMANSLSLYSGDYPFLVDPMPNLYFTQIGRAHV